MANELFKILNFINAIKTDSQLGNSFDNKIKDALKSLNPFDKKKVKEAVKNKKDGMRKGGKVKKPMQKGGKITKKKKG